ncbi:GNAT family N-acetyltransferase [uncultured Albimonas sp.]|uniref:GNAT family N-acetyltransferase n=1 Tax=uncultured Albimonas sp. TaxID=1331701 RepID=UPI0030EC827C|tara:strand:- start:405 stop:902 length:498 start_codon:yes stop_codon:yes gene_type:complete
MTQTETLSEARPDTLIVRPAREADLPAIVALMSDDELGAAREASADDPRYLAAFHAIEEQRGNTLYVAVTGDRASGPVVGCFQMIFMPGISWAGATRAEIENVRIARDLRGTGLGAQMIEQAVRIARDGAAAILQLTSNNARPDAHRFWTANGFEQSHQGFKMTL